MFCREMCWLYGVYFAFSCDLSLLWFYHLSPPLNSLNDRHMIFKLPSEDPKWDFWHLKKKLEFVSTFFEISILDLDFQILDLLSDSQISFRFSDFEIFFGDIFWSFQYFFYCIWTRGSAILFYKLFLNFEFCHIFFAYIFYFYSWFCDTHTDTYTYTWTPK